MNLLPEDILITVYKIVHTNEVLEELREIQKILRIEQCIKEFPFLKSLSFISQYSNVDIDSTIMIINNNKNIYNVFNNLYNTTFYYHRDNLWLV